jgi:hypothetical protein
MLGDHIRSYVILAAVALLLTGCASFKPDLRADFVRAGEIAKSRGDKAGQACAEAHVKAMDAKVPMPAAVGPVSLYMTGRELRRSEPDEDVEFNCARLRLDALKFLYKLGSMIFPMPPLPGR